MLNTVQPGIPASPHNHPHEQIGFLMEGRGVLYVDGETWEMEAQTAFLMPPHAAHNFDATGDKPAVLAEAFTPPREDYLERVAKAE